MLAFGEAGSPRDVGLSTESLKLLTGRTLPSDAFRVLRACELRVGALEPCNALSPLVIRC